jgi:hypothetical protein
MTRERFAFELANTFEEVIPALSRERFAVVIPTNMWLAANDIQDLVSRIRKEYPQVGILVISGWTEIKEEVHLEGPNSVRLLFHSKNFLAASKILSPGNKGNDQRQYFVSLSWMHSQRYGRPSE